jgi:ABC-type transport system involved in cytochrome c biogenesis permease subunit
MSVPLFAFVLISLIASASATADVNVNVDRLRPTAVLDRGRVKPIDSLARETIRSVTGKERFGEVRPAGADGGDKQKIGPRLDPLAMLLAWQRRPDEWEQRPLLYVPHIELRKRVGLDEKHQWISPAQLRANRAFLSWAQTLMARQQNAERTRELARLTPEEDAGILLRHRLATFDAAAGGRLVGIAPAIVDHAHAPDDGHDHSHDPWADLESLAAARDKDAASNAIAYAWGEVLGRFDAGDQKGFDAACDALATAIAPRVGASPLVDRGRLALEVRYNAMRPFRLVWIGYLFAVLGFALAGVVGRPWAYRAAMGLFLLCIAGHIAAFVIRCRITGWAPVTNMYETVVWVSLVAAIFAAMFELFGKSRDGTSSRGVGAAGAVTALIASVVADVMPPEMGRQIGPLAPVLRSNYWLTIHVLTIVASYAAFALACVLGNIGLARFAFPNRLGATAEGTARTVRLSYRSIQAGVLLIAAGTILGGLWADVSWGRFWGWDPKEVWALIVLLVYLALLHGRFAGFVGPFGLLAGAVACFTTVLMSWYGVNFVLGAGLHSYGFGSGGQGYVFSYVLLQLAWVGVATVIYRRRRTASPATEAVAVTTTSDDAPTGALNATN